MNRTKYRFTAAGWINVYIWENCPIVGEYLKTYKFDTIEGARQFIREHKAAFLD